jgi:hypothetical protein
MGKHSKILFPLLHKSGLSAKNYKVMRKEEREKEKKGKKGEGFAYIF